MPQSGRDNNNWIVFRYSDALLRIAVHPPTALREHLGGVRFVPLVEQMIGSRLVVAQGREAELPIRWEDVDQLHLTLKFLGEVRSEKVPRVKEAVARVAEKTAPFTMTLQGAGAFPTLRPLLPFLMTAGGALLLAGHARAGELAPGDAVRLRFIDGVRKAHVEED